MKRLHITIPFKRFHYTKQGKIPTSSTAHQDEWTAGPDDAIYCWYGFYSSDANDTSLTKKATVELIRYFCKLPFAQSVEHYV